MKGRELETRSSTKVKSISSELLEREVLCTPRTRADAPPPRFKETVVWRAQRAGASVSSSHITKENVRRSGGERDSSSFLAALSNCFLFLLPKPHLHPCRADMFPF